MTVSGATKELPLLRILSVQKRHLPWEVRIEVSPEVSDILSVDLRPGKLRMQRNRHLLLFECGVQAALDTVRDGGVRASEVESLRLSGYIGDVSSKAAYGSVQASKVTYGGVQTSKSTYGSVQAASCVAIPYASDGAAAKPLYVSDGVPARASHGARNNDDDNGGGMESNLYEGMIRMDDPAFAYDRPGHTLFLSSGASIVIWKVKKEPVRVIVDGDRRVGKAPTRTIVDGDQRVSREPTRVIVDGDQRAGKEPIRVIVDGSRGLEKESGQQANEGPNSTAICFNAGEQGRSKKATHEIIVSELVDKAGGDWREARFSISGAWEEGIVRQESSSPRILADVILWEASVQRIIQGEIPIAPAPRVIDHHVSPLEIESRQAQGGVLVAVDISQEIYYSLPDGLLRSARKNERFTCFVPYSQGRLTEFKDDIEEDMSMRSIWVYPNISIVSREYEYSSGIVHVALLVGLDIAVTGRREVLLLQEGSPDDGPCPPSRSDQWFWRLMRRVFPWITSNGKAPKRLHGNRIDHDVDVISKIAPAMRGHSRSSEGVSSAARVAIGDSPVDGEMNGPRQ